MSARDIIRIEIDRSLGYPVRVSSFETDVAYYGLWPWYKSIDSMPQWAQDKIAKLQIMNSPPPVTDIAGVGKRMGPNLFWIYPEEQ